jgi:hypothetical protein
MAKSEMVPIGVVDGLNDLVELLSCHTRSLLLQYIGMQMVVEIWD